MKCSAAGHASHAEHLHGLPFASEIDARFVPIDLSFLTPSVGLRNKCFVYDESHLAFSPTHVSPNTGFANRLIRQLRSNPLIDPVTGMPLFSRRFAIRFQNCTNKRYDRVQSGP